MKLDSKIEGSVVLSAGTASPFGEAKVSFASPLLIRKLARTGPNQSVEGCSNHCPALVLTSPLEAAIVGYQVTPKEEKAYSERFGVIPKGQELIAVPAALFIDLRAHVLPELLNRTLAEDSERVILCGRSLDAAARAFLESTGEVEIYADESAISVTRVPSGLGSVHLAGLQAASLE